MTLPLDDEEGLVLRLPGGIPFVAPVRADPAARGAFAATTFPIDRPDEDGVALCLSGGGWRALLFHAGAIGALARSGRLARVTRVTGVSAGAVAAAILGLAWEDVALATRDGLEDRLERHVLGPLRALAASTLDVPAILRGVLPPWRGAARALESRLHAAFRGARLLDLPRAPLVEVHATSLETGGLWVLDRDGARARGEGIALPPTIPLARAVAASAAFPPPLSPLGLAERGTRATLTDGGVHDNLGIETAWPACRTLYVSDGGGRLAPESRPSRGWIRQGLRVARIVDEQVRRLRARQVRASLALPPGVPGHRRGALWTLYDPPALGAWIEAREARALAALPTRLKKMPPDVAARLEARGDEACLAALAAYEGAGFLGSRDRAISTSNVPG